MNVSVGADPELFLMENGEIISAEGLIGGTKESPKKISEEGHAVQEDNVMIEFNIPSCTKVNDFVKEINFVLDYLKTFCILHKFELDFSASAELNPEFLRTKQARRFGCDPDFNIYTKRENEAPNARGNLRTCGGHIHVGYSAPSYEVSEKIIAAMDITLGLPSLDLDMDDRRREMYGKAGSFRFKDYGVEYRTLSNFWLKSDELKEWAFNQTLKAVQLVNTGVIDRLFNKFGKEIARTINTADRASAKELMNEINAEIGEIIRENVVV